MDTPKTIPQMFYNQVKKYGEREELRYKEHGVWKKVSWNQFQENVRSIAKSLTTMIKPEDKVCIFADNSPKWAYADLAIQAAGGIVVPLYPTSPLADILFIINECEAKIIFVDTDERIKMIKKHLEDKKITKVEKIIAFKDTRHKDETIIPIEDFKVDGEKVTDANLDKITDKIKADHLATIIYTSGTTGEPKGVMLSHSNLLSNIEGLIAHQIPINDEDITISFLPLSHAFERLIGYYLMIMVGVVIAYAESPEQLVENMKEVQPTILVSVPRFYEKIYSGTKQSLDSGFKKALFKWALSTGKRIVSLTLENEEIPEIMRYKFQLADRLIFSKLKNILGGKLKYSVSGSAPLNVEIAEFMFAAGLTVLEGYGLTETAPVISANVPGKIKLGSVGKALPNLEIRIAKDYDSQIDGEILVRGPNIMKGYYKREDETAEIMDDEGWLHTGDIGYVDGEGFLHITDRLKQLIKTSGGKYVAPQPIEQKLTEYPLVEHAIVIGDRRKYCVALISPNFEMITNYAYDHKIDFASKEELVSNPKIMELYQNLIDEVNEPLGRWEQVKYFRILPVVFSPEFGELTPTMKLKRRVIMKKYENYINEMYLE